MKKYYIVTVLFWLTFILLVVSIGDIHTSVWNKQNYPYLLDDNYNNFSELVGKLFNTDIKLKFFDYCCDVINYCANSLGFSYPQMNIIIFVIGLPSLIINMFLLIVVQISEINRLRSSF